MNNRPPYDDGPPPGGFDPRFGGRQERERRFDRAESTDRWQDDPFGRRGPDPDRSFVGAPGQRRGGLKRSTLILLGIGLVLLLGAIAFALSLTRSGPGEDRLDGSSAATNETSAAASDPEARCASSGTYDRIKRELFRQAAATRGSDAAAFDRLAGYAALRITAPVLSGQDEGLEQVSCTGQAALDLPPGVQVVGGRRTLTASIGYTLQPAADGSGDVVTLTGADAILVPLATLSRTGGAPAPTNNPPVQEPVQPGVSLPPSQPTAPPPSPTASQTPVARPTPSPAPSPPAATGTAQPSFSCRSARTRGELAVCNSSELASLDRQMAGFYVSALRGADPQTRSDLQRSRDRFLAYRDRCGNDRCIADAYRGRVTEIRDIVDGRWRGN